MKLQKTVLSFILCIIITVTLIGCACTNPKVDSTSESQISTEQVTSIETTTKEDNTKESETTQENDPKADSDASSETNTETIIPEETSMATISSTTNTIPATTSAATPTTSAATPTTTNAVPATATSVQTPSTGNSSGLATPSNSGALQVSGTHLVSQGSTPVQLRGVSTHGLSWFPAYVNETCFHQLHYDWNANVIRLSLYPAEYAGYCNGGDQESLKALIRNGVNYARNQDMYVIIDWHILSDGNPCTYQNQAIAFFDQMSTEFASYNNVLYEICNEPNGGTNWDTIKSYANAVIPVIRSHDSDAVIIVGTPNWSQQVDQAAASPLPYGNIMYALHFYAVTHRDDLRNTMVNAINSGLPVFVSEYGICDASGNGGIDTASADAWVNTLNQYGVSYVAWNLSNKAETCALINSGCGKTSNFTFEDLSASGQWLYNTLHK